MVYFVPTPAKDLASGVVAGVELLHSPALPVRTILIGANRRSLSPPPQLVTAAAS